MIHVSDLLIILVSLGLLNISIVILFMINKKEKNMNTLNKAKKGIVDLESITKNIERDYKPANVELTSYEQEQEQNAIISYEELLKKKDNSHVTYDADYDAGIEGISVKKIDTDNASNKKEQEVPNEFHISLMNYEKEEAFLKALRQLQENLAR